MNYICKFDSGYIISDNFYPKKLTKYACHTLTNINLYETPKTGKVLVFQNKAQALKHLNKIDSIVKYDVHPINKDELKKLKNCFNYEYLLINKN